MRKGEGREEEGVCVCVCVWMDGWMGDEDARMERKGGERGKGNGWLDGWMAGSGGDVKTEGKEEKEGEEEKGKESRMGKNETVSTHHTKSFSFRFHFTSLYCISLRFLLNWFVRSSLSRNLAGMEEQGADEHMPLYGAAKSRRRRRRSGGVTLAINKVGAMKEVLAFALFAIHLTGGFCLFPCL